MVFLLLFFFFFKYEIVSQFLTIFHRRPFLFEICSDFEWGIFGISVIVVIWQLVIALSFFVNNPQIAWGELIKLKKKCFYDFVE